MIFGKYNLIVGAVGLLVGGLGGLMLGATFDAQSTKDGYHLLELARFYIREGHSHSMPFALYNLIYSQIIDKLALSNRSKMIGSLTAMTAFFLPLGLLGKGLAGADPNFPPIGMLGILGFIASVIFILVGSKNIGKEEKIEK